MYMHVCEHIFIVVQYVFISNLLVDVRIRIEFVYSLYILFWVHINVTAIYLSAKAISVVVGRVYVDRLSVGIDMVFEANKVLA